MTIKIVIKDEYKYLMDEKKDAKKSKGKKKKSLLDAADKVLNAVETVINNDKIARSARLMKELVKIFSVEK